MMESFVQMSLEKYDSLKSINEHLKGKLKEEQEAHSDDVSESKKK